MATVTLFRLPFPRHFAGFLKYFKALESSLTHSIDTELEERESLTIQPIALTLSKKERVISCVGEKPDISRIGEKLNF